MGFYDTLRCHYPLPMAGANEQEFQTKSTPAQVWDDFEIRTDGTLWHQAYDQEDRSDPHATGLGRLAGIATRVNQRWEPEKMTGELRFYTSLEGAWVEFQAEMVSGQMVALTPLSPPGPKQLVERPAQVGVPDEGDSGQVVHCLIELDPAQGQYLGRIIGFPHIELSGQTNEEVNAKLHKTVASLVESGSLVLETRFVAVVAVPTKSGRSGGFGDA